MKTKILTTALFLAITTLLAQENNDKVYYLDSLHNYTKNKNIAYTRVIKDYNVKKDLYEITEYYHPSGKISMRATSKNRDHLQFDGIRIDYYENGNKKSERELIWKPNEKISEENILQFWSYEGMQTVIDGNGKIEEITDDRIHENGEIKNGKKSGIWEGNSPINNSTFKETYKNGKFISGISIDKNKNEFPYQELKIKPSPEKGITDFYQHVAKNFKAPRVPGLNGKVYVTFIIDEEGSITNIKILKDLPGYNTEKEVNKALSNYGKWIPGKKRGIPVKVMYSLPIAVNNSK